MRPLHPAAPNTCRDRAGAQREALVPQLGNRYPTSTSQAAPAHKASLASQLQASLLHFERNLHLKKKKKTPSFPPLPNHSSISGNKEPHVHTCEYPTHMSKAQPHPLPTSAPWLPFGHGFMHWQKGSSEKNPTKAQEVNLGFLRFQGPGYPKCGLEERCSLWEAHPSALGTSCPIQGNWLEKDQSRAL